MTSAAPPTAPARPPADARFAGARIGVDARLAAYRHGGIAEHVARLLHGLAELDPPESIVVLAHRRGGTAREHGFETARLRTPPHHRLEDWAMPAEVLGRRLALLHSPDVVVPRGWRGRAVATVHDVDFLRHPDRLTAESARYYAGVHRSVQRADRVIVVSEHTRGELLRLTRVEADRVRVVPNAVAPRFFAPVEERRKRQVLERCRLARPYVLYVSTIEPRKNVGTLLRAFRRLLDERRGVDLALVGADGWLSAAVYGLADELRLGTSARFLGFVPDEDLPALYAGAAVFAHPAWDEGFGLTPLEAMACGVPVVAADAGALPEVLGPAAVFEPPDDPGRWARALGRVLDEPALGRQLSEQGRARASAFPIARQATGTLEVYREVMSAADA